MTLGRCMLVLVLCTSVFDTVAARTCDAPEPVCRAAAAVVMISSFEPVGSAVVVDDGLLVTNRHLLADNAGAEVLQSDGTGLPARAVDTDYPGDLILLEAPDVAETTPLQIAEVDPSMTLYVVGFDVGRQAIRVYRPGRLLVEPAETPLARIHHDARSLPGNSGGALVDQNGRLVGIVASGGEGRNEAVPATEIARLRAASGPDKIERSLVIGRAYRRCVAYLEDIRGVRGRLAPGRGVELAEACLASNNRQLMDLAAQALGTRRDIEGALRLLRAAHDQDPHAPNTLISLAVTLHLGQRYADAVPVVREALAILPDDPQLLRLALQAGIWGDDPDLAGHAMERIEAVLPQMAPAARRFYDNPPPAPRLRPPG